MYKRVTHIEDEFLASQSRCHINIVAIWKCQVAQVKLFPLVILYFARTAYNHFGACIFCWPFKQVGAIPSFLQIMRPMEACHSVVTGECDDCFSCIIFVTVTLTIFIFKYNDTIIINWFVTSTTWKRRYFSLLIRIY